MLTVIMVSAIKPFLMYIMFILLYLLFYDISLTALEEKKIIHLTLKIGNVSDNSVFGKLFICRAWFLWLYKCHFGRCLCARIYQHLNVKM
jgi:hypothetical protein